MIVQNEENAEQHCGGAYILSFWPREKISCLKILCLQYKVRQVVEVEHEKNSSVKNYIFWIMFGYGQFSMGRW